MLILSVLIGLAVVGALMALDWYVWDPRRRYSRSLAVGPNGHNGNREIMRDAA
jgi:hypothetical protein